ncbi:MAG TPA: proline--tRNA ligase [Candidatus Saccharimonadales bacterium]|jgi:prolyl-tRNA synthetase|nr:proline--tRNA ligase [Candidatus Saccharimonadales bacterium]
MRLSQLFGKTSKTEGTDYPIDSHRLLVQGGFIRESTAGRYYLLPLGLRVHQNIERIIRKHMNQASGQEVVMPVLHPLELWQETNRTTTTGFELMKITDRRQAEFALGGTAEEMAVDLVRKFNVSYKDLPFNIYQFSMKFRDEMRARGGLLRVREFVMKDAYSFSTEEQFTDIYEQMKNSYTAIFEEMGLKTDIVLADNGYIGGEYCHEFIVESDIGESRYFIDKQSGEAAHEDVAKVQAEPKNINDDLLPLTPVDAPRGTTMEDGATLHKMPLWQQIKDVLYFDESVKRYVLVLIRGDFEVNETKLTHIADAWNLRSATDEEIREDLGSEPGFISPVNFPKKGNKSGYPVLVVADNSLRTVKNAYGGANQKNKDLLNINIDRDYKPDIEGDVALLQPSDQMQEKRGIEVGNTFQLGYHYSNLMHDAEYTDERGNRQKYYMGCYGIGLGRTMAAIVEKYHDDKGVIWPEVVAPYKVYLARLGDSEEVVKQADELYNSLTSQQVEVLYDDRPNRPGEKFADADLLGIPYRVVISDKTVAANNYELKPRTSQEAIQVSRQELMKRLGIAE